MVGGRVEGARHQHVGPVRAGAIQRQRAGARRVRAYGEVGIGDRAARAIDGHVGGAVAAIAKQDIAASGDGPADGRWSGEQRAVDFRGSTVELGAELVDRSGRQGAVVGGKTDREMAGDSQRGAAIDLDRRLGRERAQSGSGQGVASGYLDGAGNIVDHGRGRGGVAGDVQCRVMVEKMEALDGHRHTAGGQREVVDRGTDRRRQPDVGVGRRPGHRAANPACGVLPGPADIGGGWDRPGCCQDGVAGEIGADREPRGCATAQRHDAAVGGLEIAIRKSQGGDGRVAGTDQLQDAGDGAE